MYVSIFRCIDEEAVMRDFIENTIIVAGIVIGFVLFLVGVRRVFKDREGYTSLDKLLIAISLTILTMSSSYAQEGKKPERPTCYAPPRELKPADNEHAERDAAIAKRVNEVVSSKEWQELKTVADKLNKLLKTNSRNNRIEGIDALSEWMKTTNKEIGSILEGGRIKREQELENAPLLSKENAIKELKYLTLEVANHLCRMYSATCYKRASFTGNTVSISKQKELLKKQLNDGKITQEIYDRVMRTMGAYETRHTVVAKGLNEANSILVFELLKQISIEPVSQEAIEERAKEVAAAKEWAELRNIWGMVLDGKALSEPVLKWNDKTVKELEAALEQYELNRGHDGWHMKIKRNPQDEFAPLIKTEDAVTELKYIILSAINSAKTAKANTDEKMSCYKPMPSFEQSVSINDQMALLEKQLKDKKITKEFFEKAKRALEVSNEARTPVAMGLNRSNSALIFRLLTMLSAPAEEKK